MSINRGGGAEGETGSETETGSENRNFKHRSFPLKHYQTPEITINTIKDKANHEFQTATALHQINSSYNQPKR